MCCTPGCSATTELLVCSRCNRTMCSMSLSEGCLIITSLNQDCLQTSTVTRSNCLPRFRAYSPHRSFVATLSRQQVTDISLMVSVCCRRPKKDAFLGGESGLRSAILGVSRTGQKPSCETCMLCKSAHFCSADSWYDSSGCLLDLSCPGHPSSKTVQA